MHAPREFRRAAVRGVAIAALGLWLGGVTDRAQAQDPSDGLRIARQWCVSCHIVEPGGMGSDAARPFERVANDPNFTEDGLRAWLADPHPPMPNLSLTRGEIDSVVAYILSLRHR